MFFIHICLTQQLGPIFFSNVIYKLWIYIGPKFLYFFHGIRGCNELQYGCIFFCVDELIHQKIVLAISGTNIVHMCQLFEQCQLHIFSGDSPNKLWIYIGPKFLYFFHVIRGCNELQYGCIFFLCR